MDILREDKFNISNSIVTVQIVNNLEFEDLVVLKALANMHETETGKWGLTPPIRRSIKDYLIKGE